MYFNFKKKISSILLAAAFVTGLFVPAYAANEVEVFMKDVTSESEVLAGEAKIAISAKGSGTMNIAQIGFTVEGDMVCKSLESKVDAPDDVRSSLRVLPGKESDQLYVSMAYGAPAIQLNENTETELCVLTFSGDVDDEVTLTLIEDEDSYFTPNYPADKQTLEAVAGDDVEETAQAADTGANAVNAKVTLEMNKVQDIQLDTDTYKINPINISITGEGENPIVFITDFEDLSTATAKILELNTKLLDTMTYTVKISAAGYKTYTVSGQTFAEALLLSNTDFVPGDVNTDGVVDGVDKAEFNKIKNNGEYKVYADFDRNGEVDENDARVFEGIEEALTKPAKMSRPTVTGGSYQITVNWIAPADTSITGYVLKYGASSVNLSTRLELGANERQKTIESLSAGTTYYVAIAAINEAGEGEFSDIVSGVTAAAVGGNSGGGGGGGSGWGTGGWGVGGTCGEALRWEFDSRGVLTIKGTGNMDNYNKYSDRAPWFEYSEDVFSVNIENGVTSIGECAFFECINLMSVNIADSVVAVGNEAFCCCYALTEIELPDSIVSMGSGAFGSCVGLTKINVPEKMTDIASALFTNCKSLKKIELPQSIIRIGRYAFQNCSSLGEIEIPDSVTTIENALFMNCINLTKVEFPQNTISIGMYAFSGCSNLVTVDIPGTLTEIKDEAFMSCGKLKSINIPKSVIGIGAKAFEGCTSLDEIYIDDINNWQNIKFIDEKSYPLHNGGNLYLNGELLENLTIPLGITKINSCAFYGCESLKSVKIPSSVKTIYSTAFYNCKNLSEIYIEKGLLTVVTDAFKNCDAVTNIYYSGSEEEWDNILIGGNNDCLTNKEIIKFGTVIPKTYTFVTNGGSVVSNIEGEISECPVTTKEYNEFQGWYDNAELSGEPISFPYSGIKTTLYAKWEPVVYIDMELLSSTPQYDVYTVTAVNVPINSSIVFACYNDGVLACSEIRTYNGENPVYFVEQRETEYNMIKVFAWDSISSMKPVCAGVKKDCPLIQQN
ncbi:MAG: leucine-rich repeat protein [Clostridia bacterium]|nr:leucine-rich repeat protein [Clostridia bacterium]